MRVAAWIAAGVLSACALGAQAGTERYEYDLLGRLIWYINPAGQVTEYVYDAVGNILAVRRSTDSGPPTISLVSPPALRRGQSATIQLQGTRLAGTQLASPDPTLVITRPVWSATLLSFILTAAETAPLGAQSFSASNALGSAGFQVTIQPALPKLTGDPSPVVLAPGGQQRVTLRLSNLDQTAHTLSLSVPNAAVAAVSPPSLELAPGQTDATVTITATGVGTTVLDIASATLERSAISLFVALPQTGPGTAYAGRVGVVRPAAQVAAAGPVVAPVVGIVRPVPGPSNVSPVVAAPVGVVRPVAQGGSFGPVQASMVGVTRAEAAQPQFAPLAAPNVGVERQ